jgi:hypothetical protein
MFCTQCGTDLADAPFCPKCGKQSILTGAQRGPGATVRRRPTAITLLAAQNLFWVVAMIAGLFLDDPQYANPAAKVSFALFGALFLTAGIGLLRLRRIGRTVQLWLTPLFMLLIPIGTIFGIAVIWYLRRPHVRALFAAVDVAADIVAEPAAPARRGWRWAVILLVVIAAAGAAAVAYATLHRPAEEPAPQGPASVEIGTLDDERRNILPDANNLTKEDIASVALAGRENNQVLVEIRFTEEGARKMRALSSANIGRSMGFRIDGVLDDLQPTIQGQVAEVSQITFLDEAEAERFVVKLGGRPFRGK